jgi:iron complex outermembrane receptor protein
VVLGSAIQRDALVSADLPGAEYTFTAPAAFAQHTWTPTPWLGLTSSARVDAHNEYGTFFSPRVALLVRSGEGWTVRLSGGGGEYAPSPFVEDTEEIGLRRQRPFLGVGGASLRPERARSLSADVGGLLGPIEVLGSVYASVIHDAVAVRDLPGDSVVLENVPERTRTRGAEFVAVYRRDHTRLTVTYSFLEATEWDVDLAVRRSVPLTARHSVGLMGMWEPKEASGVGVEAFYTGRQPLSENPYRTESRPFVVVGALARWRFGRIVLFINSENLTGVRQTRIDPLLRPTPGTGGRWTVDAWAPLDGRVVNAGMQIHLGALHEEAEHKQHPSTARRR